MINELVVAMSDNNEFIIHFSKAATFRVCAMLNNYVHVAHSSVQNVSSYFSCATQQPFIYVSLSEIR